MEMICAGLEPEHIATSVHRRKVCASGRVRARARPSDPGLGWRGGTVDTHDLDRLTRRTSVRDGDRISDSKRTSAGQKIHRAAGTGEPDHFVNVGERCGILPIGTGTIA